MFKLIRKIKDRNNRVKFENGYSLIAKQILLREHTLEFLRSDTEFRIKFFGSSPFHDGMMKAINDFEEFFFL
jgi:hypothetical protein